jgi:DNA-binding transcriptional ArsR family regulator
MTTLDDRYYLKFACECVSARSGYSDPWAAVAQKKLLPDGTKEEILNRVARQPKTVAHLAKELGLSQPSVHSHVGDLIASELLRESQEWKKQYPTERYYELNFLVVTAEEQAKFQSLCGQLATAIADLFEKEVGELERAFDPGALTAGGWRFSDLTQYLYASIQRGAREILEERSVLPAPTMHRNGARWHFWAQEAIDGAGST